MMKTNHRKNKDDLVRLFDDLFDERNEDFYLILDC